MEGLIFRILRFLVFQNNLSWWKAPFLPVKLAKSWLLFNIPVLLTCSTVIPGSTNRLLSSTNTSIFSGAGAAVA